MSVIIRKLSMMEDLHQCAEMMSSSEPWITLQRDYEKAVRVFQEELNENYVAEVSGRIAGFMILQLRGAFVGYIRSLGVAPEMRGQGIGTALLDFAEELVFSMYPNLFICTSSFNPRARALYERRGFREVGELTEFIVPGHSEILMRKTTGPLCSFARA
ncbi:MAG: GNAT family N-acetyltransferase [Candidatus Saccharibacteria bacterium]